MSADKNLDNLRHSTAHLLAAAIMELWPNTKRTIGPAIENGFYFDFDFSTVPAENKSKTSGEAAHFVLSEDDLPKIEAKMRELLPSWKGFERHELTADEAKKEYPNNQFKHELIDEFTKDGEKVSFYKSGEYWDLCKGGHVEHPDKELKHFKLLSVAGAYWRGNEKNPMLTRIYGTVWPTQKELDDYIAAQEEAKKRDHRRLGKELDLFAFSDLVGKGLPLFTPKGTVLRDLLNSFSQNLRAKQGYVKVWTPHITKKELYETSGHWAKFGDELFLVKSQETSDEMVLKPMNCPHHQQIYASKPRSYKDLPLKYMETTTDYRDEKAGELIGLNRVRSLTQDDSHTFCTPEQIEGIYELLIKTVQDFYSSLDMTFRARLSFRDPKDSTKYLGEDKLWEQAQKILLNVAKRNKLDYFIAEGEAAFYGPKIDFMVKDSLGREWQLATPQLDFVQPARFGLTYIDETGREQTPVMIHFALMGSLERFLAVYIEHTAGNFPVWLAPVQVKIIPIADRHLEYAQSLLAELEKFDVRGEIAAESETMQAKIRDAQLQKIPYMAVVGDREQVQKTLALRSRDGENHGTISIAELVRKIQDDQPAIV